MPLRFRVLPLLLLVSSLACERPAEQKKEREFAAKLLNGLLAYPRSTLEAVSAGSDAAQVTFSTPAPVEVVAKWYRQMLSLNGWELQNDAVANGTVTIYAQKGPRPLWIMLAPEDGGRATRYTLVGAELPRDTAQAQRSGSSMSSNRIQRR